MCMMSATINVGWDDTALRYHKLKVIVSFIEKTLFRDFDGK